MGRKGAEFSRRTRKTAIRNAGLESGEVHHRLGIHEGRKRGVCDELLKAPFNAQGMTVEEHRRTHRGMSQAEYDDMAGEYLRMQPRLFDT